MVIAPCDRIETEPERLGPVPARPDRGAKSELERQIERVITQRTWGRIRGLRVEICGQRVRVDGCTSTYYVKQLAIQAIVEAFGQRVVELNIRVA